MNWKHIESTCRGEMFRTATVDGKRVATNGHIAFPFSGEFDLKPDPKWEQFEALANLWAKCAAMPCAPAIVGDCMGGSRHFRRKVGGCYAAERFIRCFDGDVTWAPSSGPKDPILVHRGGELIGVVMPMSNCEDEKSCNPADEDVFGPYASEENGWYLIDGKTIAEKIKHAERERHIAKDRLEELEAEVEEWDVEIRSLRERLRTVAA